MTNKQIEQATERIIEMLNLKKVKGFYKTSWGRKTITGLRASIFNIIANAQNNLLI